MKLKLDELNRVSVEEFKTQEKIPVIVILDNVRSMHNVGSIFRTCDGFAVQQVILCGITGQPPHREIEKTALGATHSIDWAYYNETTEAIHALKTGGYHVVAVEQARNSIQLNEFKTSPQKQYALIFGNEVNGVSDEAMSLIDECIEIPQFGTKHSFNIVVSAGIVLWDISAKLNLGY